jgi:hypothetical protein
MFSLLCSPFSLFVVSHPKKKKLSISNKIFQCDYECSAISSTNVMNERPSTSKETSSNVGSPSPRKKRTNSTPINRKNTSEKKMILQQLISPNTNTKVR